MPRWSAVAVIPISLIVFGVCTSCTKSKGTTKLDDAVSPVAVARVSRHDLIRQAELAAEFRPDQEIELYSKVSGYLKAIHVDVGDVVRQGQQIAEIEVPELVPELAQASASLKRAELDVERARGEVQRADVAFGIRELSYNRVASVMQARPTLVAQQELDDYSARYRDAAAQLATAKASLSVAEEQVRLAAASKARTETMAAYLKISAPFSGLITQRHGDPGAMIQAGTSSHTQALPVVRLSKVDHLRLILPVPESLVSRIRVGQPIEVRVDTLNRVFQGRVSRSTGKLDTSTRTMETEVDIPNPERALKPGMYGFATLQVERKLDALSVPIQAISGQGSTASVLLVNGKKELEERRVDLGMETPELVEVRSGLSENDLVVVGNRSRLRVGMRVLPKTSEKAPAPQEGH
jgi:RND family efflux transporter MFP subunit